MRTLEVRIQRSGDRYQVLTVVDGGNAWGLGVDFPMWVGARAVAVTIAKAAGARDGGFDEIKIVDTTTEAA